MGIRIVPYLTLATIGLVASLASPGPALFAASTLNWYSVPSLSPGTVAVS